jgi:hypothetical protein
MIVDRLTATAEEVLAGTGWDLEPEGACRGEVCVPLPAGTVLGPDAPGGPTRVDLEALADRLGMPLVADEVSGRWALGPATLSGHALVTAEAPDVPLADLDGRPCSLGNLRGRKVCLVSWAPY